LPDAIFLPVPLTGEAGENVAMQHLASNTVVLRLSSVVLCWENVALQHFLMDVDCVSPRKITF